MRREREMRHEKVMAIMMPFRAWRNPRLFFCHGEGDVHPKTKVAW